MDYSKINFDELRSELVAFRRERHRHPENGWTEFLTTSEVIKKLESFGIPYIYGKEIHTKEKRYGLPSEENLKACMERAISEGADPQLVKNMEGGYTGVVAIIDTGRPGPTTGIRCDMDCNDVRESKDKNHFPVAEGFDSIHPNLMHG